MNAPAAYTREQQETDELCAGAIRALSGSPSIRYRGRRLHDGHRPLPIHAAHLQPDAALQDLPSLRGAADSVALRLLHTDAALHKSLCPVEPVARLVFELLEHCALNACARTPRRRHRQPAPPFHGVVACILRFRPGRRRLGLAAVHGIPDVLVAPDGQARAGKDGRFYRGHALVGVVATERRPGRLAPPPIGPGRLCAPTRWLSPMPSMPC